MSRLTPNQWTILESLQDGPRWIRSFHAVKPLLDDLIAHGLVERCRPPFGAARNMVRLTEMVGCATRLDTFAEHPANGLSVNDAARLMGHDQHYGNSLMQRLRRRLGPQAA